MAAVADSPHLRNVRRLRLGCGTHDLTPEAIGVLATSPLLGQLTELSTSYPSPRPHTDWDNPLEGLLSSERTAGLRVLRLRRPLACKLPLNGLLRSPHLANLRCLDLANCMLADARLDRLAGAASLPNLRELNLSGCKIGDNGLRAFCEAKGLPKLTALNLDRGVFSAEAVREFARGPLVGQLRWLSVQGPRMPVVLRPGEREMNFHREIRVGDAIAAAFASSPRVAGLVYLDLGNHRLTDAGLRVLAESPHLAGLLTLRLWNNEIGAADLRSGGVSALVLSEYLQRLVTVDLRSNPLPREAKLALRQRFGYGVTYGRGPLPQAASMRPA